VDWYRDKRRRIAYLLPGLYVVPLPDQWFTDGANVLPQRNDDALGQFRDLYVLRSGHFAVVRMHTASKSLVLKHLKSCPKAQHF
jgi:hypothetical protein